VKLKASKNKSTYKICIGGHNAIFNTTITKENQIFIYLMFLNQLQVLQIIKGDQIIKTEQQIWIWNILIFYPNICLERQKNHEEIQCGGEGMKK
jgi:hypothetical protein